MMNATTNPGIRTGFTASAIAITEIFRLTLRQLLGRRRTLLLLLMAALPIFLAVIYRLANETNQAAFIRDVFNGVALTIVLPITAVLFGTGAFGAENDDGTIVYLLAKPIPRWVLIAAKTIGALALTIALAVSSVAIAGYVGLSGEGNAGDVIWASVIATIVGSVCYIAVFVALSLFTKRALVIGIGYVLVWEGALSALLAGISNLSIRQYALGAGAWVYDLSPEKPARVPPETAFVLAAIVVVVAIVLATWKLMRFELPGGD